MPVKRPCLEPGCPNYAETQGLSSRQRFDRGGRCAEHRRAINTKENRARQKRPDTIIRRDPAYRAIPKPHGLRCVLRIEGVCTGWATTWDAIVPLARGGTHHPSNLQPACRECNSSKGAR